MSLDSVEKLFRRKREELQGRRKRSDHSDLGRTKILPFAVKVLYFQNFGRTNNCLVEVFLKWSDQSWTPSATAELPEDFWRKCVKHVKKIEENYWASDRIQDNKVEQLIIKLKPTDSSSSEMESFSESIDSSDSDQP